MVKIFIRLFSFYAFESNSYSGVFFIKIMSTFFFLFYFLLSSSCVFFHFFQFVYFFFLFLVFVKHLFQASVTSNIYEHQPIWNFLLHSALGAGAKGCKIKEKKVGCEMQNHFEDGWGQYSDILLKRSHKFPFHVLLLSKWYLVFMLWA